MGVTAASRSEAARVLDHRLADGAELFRRWQVDGDSRAREELVRRHLSLANKLARRYASTLEPFDDLYQVASLGLVKAIDRFDPDRGVVFSTYAVPTILGELKRHFRDKGWSVHLPRILHERVLKVREAEATLARITGRSPTVLEIAEYLELETELVIEALEAAAAHNAASLDAPIQTQNDDGPMTRHDALGAEDERFELVDVSVSLAAAARRLSRNDRRVLALRLREDLTQQEIANHAGVSQMQVSRILRRIGSQLNDLLEIDGVRRAARRGAPVRNSSRRAKQ